MMESDQMHKEKSENRDIYDIKESVDGDGGDDESNVGHSKPHDGFGNINYIKVFDAAIIEIFCLIKTDTWRRFKSYVVFVFVYEYFKVNVLCVRINIFCVDALCNI